MASNQTASEAFLQSRPTETHLRAQVCPKVGREWRTLSTYLNIPTTTVDKLLESHKHNVDEAFFRVLSVWRQREGATWDRLLQAMRETGLNAPVRELLEWMSSGTASPHGRDTELHPQASLLKKCAYDEYRRFKLGEGPKASAEYVNLAVLEKPPSSKTEVVKDAMKAMERFRDCGPKVADDKASHVTPIDLLKKGSKRICVVYGQAGSGKTTLLKQMCRALSCDEAESDFNVVLYFPLRERSVSGASDLQSLLRYYGREDSRLDRAALAQEMVESSGKGLLLVFDGADEVKDLLKPSSGSVVQSILEGRILHEAHIIVSSRPGACPSLQDHSATFYEVQGFDHAAITSYVKGFFGATPSAADSMLSQLETRPDLMGVAYIPMNTFILCTIFKESNFSFPPTMTACYQAFVCDVLARHGVECDPSLRSLSKDVQSLLHSLGVLAFTGLCQRPPQFVFDKYSMPPSFHLAHDIAITGESQFKGLLHVHAERKGAYRSSYSFSFPHGTQQEFFAALHLSTLEEDEQVQFWRENLFNTSFSVVLRFHAGLTGLCSPQVAKEVCSSLTGAAKGGITSHSIGYCSNNNPQLLFLFHALCESRNLPLTKEVMQHIPSSLEFWLSLSAFDTMAIAHCLSQCSHLRLLSLPYYSCPLLSPQCLSHLTEVLQSNPHCQLVDELDLSWDHFSAGDAQTLADIAVSLREVHLLVSHTECTALSTVCSLPSVKELVVTVHNDVKDDSGWPLVESSLANNKQLEDLKLDGCDTFLANMGKALTKNTSVRTLSLLRKKPLPDDAACAIGTCVAAMTQLRRLWMHDLSLPVMKTLADRTQPLEDLDVYPPGGVNWDGINEEQWKEAEKAIATAKVKVVYLVFNDKSTERRRAIQAVTAGLSSNTLIEEITMRGVPQEMQAAVEDKLHSSSVRVHVYSYI